MENTQEEQKWALGTLTIFVILLIISGISDFVEVGIGVCTFLFSWLAVSYSIRNFGKGGTSKQELQTARRQKMADPRQSYLCEEEQQCRPVGAKQILTFWLIKQVKESRPHVALHEHHATK